MSDAPAFPAAWIRAVLPTAILACLKDGPLHGYAIAQALGARGFGVPRGGSLYPALSKLEDSGLVTTRWVEGASGPGRKDYTITPAGGEALSHDLDAVAALERALGDSPAQPASDDSASDHSASDRTEGATS